MQGLVYKSTGSWYLVKDEKNIFIECKLADLTSRMLSSIVIEVSYPSQDLLCKIIQKYLNDRNVELSEKCLKYISDRMERSYDSAISIAEKIDAKSMESKAKTSL